MNNKLLLLTLTIFLAFFVSCKKKETTTPAPPASYLTASGAVKENLVTSSGSAIIAGTPVYEIEGIDVSGSYPNVIALILTKPTSNYSVSFPSSNTNLDIGIIDTKGNQFLISSGTVNVNIVNSYIVVSFNNATFTADTTVVGGVSNTVIASGSLSGN